MDQMDLNILSLSRVEGQDQIETPGLFIATQPRRPARGRQSDRLILYLWMAGNAPLPADQQTHLLDRLGQTYYKTPGSVTAAQRAVAEALNHYLLDRNQRGASSGRQGIGLLTILSVRNDRSYMAQCGPMHAFLIYAAGAKHIHEPLTAGRGLGLGRTTPIHYSQIDLNPNDTLLFSPAPPPTWTANTLSGLHNQPLESLRRNLLSQAGSTLNAVLLQARIGSGKTFLMRPKPGQKITYAQPRPETDGPIVEAAHPEFPSEAAHDLTQGTGTIVQEKIPEDDPGLVPAIALGSTLAAGMVIGADTQHTPATPRQPVTADEEAMHTATAAPRERTPRQVPGRDGLASVGRSINSAVARAGLGIRNLFLRMLPGESFATLPSSVMVTVAIAVPLIVVTIAAVVYFQSGRTGQFQAHYAQAVQAAGYARNQTDPNLKVAAWQSVINYLEQAESYQVTSETQALRYEANLVFDDLNLIRRLAYQPAITSKLPDSTNITHLVATESDLYMLNAEGGNVIRSLTTSTGYEIDPTFQCASGSPTPQTDMLIDIVPAPKSNEFNATVLALDANGNLLHCIPGQPPVFTPLSPPSKGWGNPQAFTIDLGHLYVLDPDKNTVWIYWDSNYTQPPEEFFIADFPMQNVVDLTVDKSDLYMLHEDGHTTFCTYSALSVAPSRCINPLPYIDSRPGHEGQEMAIQPALTQLLATQPPDPSLYYLQSQEQAIYRFSLRVLTYYGQFRPQINAASGAASASRPATAFTLSPDARLAFLAVGNQVFYTVLQ